MKFLSAGLLALLLTVGTVAASAADLAGKWAADVQGRNGATRHMIINFSNGDSGQLTGAIGGEQHQVPVQNLKVEGDTVSFDVTRQFGDRTVTRHYDGKVNGSQIDFSVTGPNSKHPMQFSATKQS